MRFGAAGKMRHVVKIFVVSVLIVGAASGHALRGEWVRDGTPVCVSTWESLRPHIVSDGSGGAIIVWLDKRNENSDIYAQRINAEGDAVWRANGVPICTAIGRKSDLHFVPDGAGGAIIVWNDRRVEWDMFAQRVRSNGEIAWQLDGVPVCMADDEQKYLSIVSDGSGGAIMGWVDLRFGWDEFCVYVQRIDSAGNVLWDREGVQLLRGTLYADMPVLASDGEGGAIVTWGRADKGWVTLYSQRVNEFGDAVWEEDVLLSAAQEHRSATWTVPDGSGGAISVWWDRRITGRDIYAQRIDGSGKILWKKFDAVVCAEPKHQMFPRIIPDGGGGATVAWHDARNGNWDIYAQRLDRKGKMRWEQEGIPVCTAAGHQRFPRIVGDGRGGAVVMWDDERNGSDNIDIYAQWIGGSGRHVWRTDGEPVITAPGDQISSDAVSDGTGGLIFTWTDYRSNTAGIYAHRLDLDERRGRRP
jgi:hypothetical protein